MDSKAPTGLHTPRVAKLFGIVALPWFALQNFLNPESGCITLPAAPRFFLQTLRLLRHLL